MTRRSIERAVDEAKRFLLRADVALADMKERGLGMDSDNATLRSRAACRRASLDLTNALADMRR